MFVIAAVLCAIGWVGMVDPLFRAADTTLWQGRLLSLVMTIGSAFGIMAHILYMEHYLFRLDDAFLRK